MQPQKSIHSAYLDAYLEAYDVGLFVCVYCVCVCVCVYVCVGCEPWLLGMFSDIKVFLSYCWKKSVSFAASWPYKLVKIYINHLKNMNPPGFIHVICTF